MVEYTEYISLYLCLYIYSIKWRKNKVQRLFFIEFWWVKTLTQVLIIPWFSCASAISCEFYLLFPKTIVYFEICVCCIDRMRREMEFTNRAQIFEKHTAHLDGQLKSARNPNRIAEHFIGSSDVDFFLIIFICCSLNRLHFYICGRKFISPFHTIFNRISSLKRDFEYVK